MHIVARVASCCSPAGLRQNCVLEYELTFQSMSPHTTETSAMREETRDVPPLVVNREAMTDFRPVH